MGVPDEFVPVSYCLSSSATTWTFESVSTCGRTRHRRTTLSAAPSLFLLLLVGSRNGVWLRRFDLSVAPRFLWECLTNRTVSWFPSPATSNGACRFLALRSPARFARRFMGYCRC